MECMALLYPITLPIPTSNNVRGCLIITLFIISGIDAYDDIGILVF